MNSTTPIRILYIHLSGTIGGAPLSLIQSIRSVGADRVEAHVLLPNGPAVQLFNDAGCTTYTVPGIAKFDNTSFGYYRGWRWAILLRELLYLPTTIQALRRLAATGPVFDIVHINEITCLPAAVLAKRILKATVVVHVRSVQRLASQSLRSRMIARAVSTYVDALIPIDAAVRRSIPSQVRTITIPNSFTPAEVPEPRRLDVETQLRPDSFRVALVGGLILEKGVMDFLEAVRLCRASGLNIEAIVAGENPREISGFRRTMLEAIGLKHDMARMVRRFIEQHRLDDTVHLVGFTSDVASIYRATNVLCFPCYVEAIGRPVFEAAFFGRPAIATERASADGDAPAFLTDIAVPPRDPTALADRLRYLYDNQDVAEEIGRQARDWAIQRFDPDRNADRLMQLYRELMECRQKDDS